ncbi:acetylserotonin O-methyltransferase [Tateyamaria sp.]|nr:acetylserotonin O-methyltransferase [Tateyamaria sp.]
MISDDNDLPFWRGGWLNRLVARPDFQSWASWFPIIRRQARSDGAALFDIVQGFVQSQVLMALVELKVFQRLKAGPLSAKDLGHTLDISTDRMHVILQAGAALGLLKRKKNNRFVLARKGAALMGVPGLEAMIRHHRAFYDDLRDPVNLLRGPTETELSKFWPYVFGSDVPAPEALIYSDLMAQSQRLVAEDTLRAVSFKDAFHILDVGGGTGAFLEAVGVAAPKIHMTLFDLPPVVSDAEDRFARVGMTNRVNIVPGSFLNDAFPEGPDTISLVRVLYDHADDTVNALLAKVYAALPVGGRLIISEPMGGGTRPERAGDVYFALYTMAMQTGRTRSSEEISVFLSDAGFEEIAVVKSARPYITQVIIATRTN